MLCGFVLLSKYCSGNFPQRSSSLLMMFFSISKIYFSKIIFLIIYFDISLTSLWDTWYNFYEYKVSFILILKNFDHKMRCSITYKMSGLTWWKRSEETSCPKTFWFFCQYLSIRTYRPNCYVFFIYFLTIYLCLQEKIKHRVVERFVLTPIQHFSSINEESCQV